MLGVLNIFQGYFLNINGLIMNHKAEEIWKQMERAEEEIDKICAYMKKLSSISKRFDQTLKMVNKVYIKHLNRFIEIVEVKKKIDWNDFLDEERIIVENTVLLVSLLYNMGKVKLVLSSKDEDGFDKINTKKVDESILNAEIFIGKSGLGAML